jgi:putative ABC transport system ATP-binding protein
VTTAAGLTGTELRLVRSGQTILDGVTLGAARGEMLAIVGPSGSGKTSLLSLLSGLVRPDAGTVGFDGEVLPVLGRRRKGASTARIGVVLQGHGLVPVLSAAENVEVVLQARRLRVGEVRDTAAEVLHRVLLSDVSDRLVERLSGGQQQRVAVARALVGEPDLLVADEPTSELDEDTRDHVVGQLRMEAERGAVVVVATHDPDIVASCDRAMQVEAGHLRRI